jgi:hypothetical protein
LVKGDEMKIDSKVKKVDENVNVFRYDNGFMVEFTGRDAGDNYLTRKYICQTEAEVFAYLSEIFAMPKNE